MNGSLSEAIKEAYATAPSDVVIINTIELRHQSITDPLFLAQERKNLLLTLEDGRQVVFEAVPFRITLPQAGDNGLQELNITIDNIDRRISDFCQLAKSFPAPVEVLYRPYLSNDFTTPQMIPPLRLFLKDISITVTEVAARATMADLINKKFPKELYTRERFPGIGE